MLDCPEHTVETNVTKRNIFQNNISGPIRDVDSMASACWLWWKMQPPGTTLVRDSYDLEVGVLECSRDDVFHGRRPAPKT
jgi:hypothetical protein